MKRLLVISIALICGISCNDIENCNADDNTSFLIVGYNNFKTKGGRSDVGFRVQEVNSPYTISAFVDSTAIGLPLNPEDTVVTYTFTTDSSSFQLQVRYDREFSVFDAACEPSITFTGLDTLTQTFDSLVIESRIANREIDTNLEVYF